MNTVSINQEAEEVTAMRQLVPFLMCAVVACAPAPVANAEEDFSAHWHDGRAELDGYERYAQRVRYRLLPGIW